jgi:hypothetical protein
LLANNRCWIDKNQQRLFVSNHCWSVILLFFFVENQQRLFCKKHCCFPIQQWFLPKNHCQFSINNNDFLVKTVVDSHENLCVPLSLSRNPYAHSKTFACLCLSLENLCTAPSVNSKPLCRAIFIHRHCLP